MIYYTFINSFHFMTKLIYFFCFFCLLFSKASSQELRVICWSGVNSVLVNDSLVNLLDFKNSTHDSTISENNIYVEKIPINSELAELTISDVEYLNILDSELNKVLGSELTNDIKYDYFIGTEKKKHYVYFYLSPFVKDGDLIKKVSSFKIQIHENTTSKKNLKKDVVDNSILSSGNWYKIGVTETGIHKIDFNFLNSLGIDVNSLNPDFIRIYGNKAGVLEEGLVEVDDLLELAIDVYGDQDGSFDSDDYVLFYGQSPHIWEYNGDEFIYQKNIYTDTMYYFLSIDLGVGKRIPNIPHNYILGDPTESSPVTSYDTYFIHENDEVNLVNTGRQWFGESFSFDYNQDFNTPITTWLNDSILLNANFAVRSSGPSNFEISNNENTIISHSISSISSSSDTYYIASSVSSNFAPTTSDSYISINYNNNANTSALAWLDYFSLQGRASLSVDETSHFLFRDTKSLSDSDSVNFKLSKSLQEHGCIVWNVTDPMNVTNQLLANVNPWDCFFKTTSSTLQEFLVISDFDNAFSPHFVDFVPNQNIHGSEQPSYIIVAHPNFMNSANRLADYHINLTGDNVLVVSTEQVYNEFSTGSQDISAIRNLVKMFYDRAETDDDVPKNLLLFGDASFDYKNKLYGLTNFVPTYESYASSNIETSYCTDDYFGVLDDGEGMWNGGLNSNAVYMDLLDIGIGRIPVSNTEDAEKFIDKIIHYSSLSSRGNWKNEICFVADDVDVDWEDNLIIHADALANKVDTLYPKFNINKIYLDSYEQSLSLGSQRYPDAQSDLIKLIEDGVFIINYVGHGGEVGWASERILELSDINGFQNIDKLPVFITATCEFTRYDDPNRISAGEYLLLNPSGGAIGLYSTSRTVGESATYALVNSLYNYLPDENLNLTFGESLNKAKNDPLTSFNSIKRRFSFFGDPHLKLAQPDYTIHTTSIQLLDSLGILMSSSDNLGLNDTIHSLSHVRVSGEIKDASNNDENNILSDFSGVLFAKVFDKPSLYTTLNNDGVLSEPFNYYLQNNTIYNGKVDVINGLWSFEFIVPKDISYHYGNGKISCYASDSIMGEASGLDQNLVVGGVSDYAAIDLDGPTIKLFMNDTNFVSGGYTNTNPELLALLFDESGINTIGTGIGHDLTATLDEDNWGQYILNDYYESDLNSFQSGQVVFPFSDLTDGEHSLSFKAWDVYNNSSIVSIDFFVTSSSELAIQQLFNYPNPSSSFTQFVFEHNRPGEVLDVRVDIFSLNGELVKTLSSSIFTTGFRDESITWNIDPSITRGIYIYRLLINSQNDNSISQKTEKLIIVR